MGEQVGPDAVGFDAGKLVGRENTVDHVAENLGTGPASALHRNHWRASGYPAERTVHPGQPRRAAETGDNQAAAASFVGQTPSGGAESDSRNDIHHEHGAIGV